MHPLPPPAQTCSFIIALGIMDVEVLVLEGGDVWVTSPAPLPDALKPVVESVLGTWMIDYRPDENEGETMIGPRMWREYFGHRTVEALAAA